MRRIWRDIDAPWGALVVIAVGLLACVAAALLSTDEPIGAAALAWETRGSIPTSKLAAIAGSGAMRIGGGAIRATAPNASGYELYRVAAVLTISRGAAVEHGRVRCSTRVPSRAIVTRTPSERAAYPRPSEELIDQPVPPRAVVEFSAQGANLATIEMHDAFRRFTTEPGIKVDWAPYRPTRQEWEWGLPAGRPRKPLTLAFTSIWRTTSTPAARIACSVTTGAGTATTAVAGSLKK
ncbi:MAG TPA: hypothetical protein VNY83_00305 [Solirubrobacterales bacterium]|nr:hypothetical protein [Solirubrobacterales bacterium]